MHIEGTLVNAVCYTKVYGLNIPLSSLFDELTVQAKTPTS